MDSEIRQRLLELIYDVLPEDEAAELRGRIESDPQIARAYAETQALSGLLTEAARLETPKIELKCPDAIPVAAVASIPAAAAPKHEAPHAKPAARAADPLRKPRMRGITWLVSLAAGILLTVSLGAYLYHRGQLVDIAADHLRLQVVGPSRLQPWAANRYTINTTSVTGNPVSAQVQFALYSPSGQQLMGHKERTSEKGLLELTIPTNLSASHEARLEIEAACDGKVQRVDTRLAVDPLRFATFLTTDKRVFEPGETVRYRSLTLARFSLSAEQQMAVRYEAIDPGGSIVPDSNVQTIARDGVGSGQVVLPADASDGVYSLVAQSPDGRFPDQRCPFTVRRRPWSAPNPKTESLPGKVLVQFYPESGQLVAGLENRVFFRAADPQGQPVQVRGTIVDIQDSPLAPVESVHDGMGAFSFEPRSGQQYRLKLTSPEKTGEQPPLPPVSNAEVLLTTGLGVFKADQPLDFNVRARTAGIPLVATAWCRGAAVGQRTLVTNVGANSVEVPVDQHVAGLVRLVIYDYRSSPPTPVAQRLVYRRPARQLQIHAACSQADSSGKPVNVSLTVADESGKPLPAILGVSVLDESVVPELGGGNSSMLGYFLLGSELEQETKNIDHYLSTDPKAAVALDLLLAAQAQPLADGQETKPSGPNMGARENRFASLFAAVSPPAVFDNLTELQDRYKDTVASYRADRTRLQNSVTMISLFGGLGLALFVALLAIMNIPTGLRLWAPTLGAAIACVVIGAYLMNPEQLQSVSGNVVAFAPFNAAPPTATFAAKGAPPAAEMAQTVDRPRSKAGDQGKAPADTLVRNDKLEDSTEKLALDSKKLQAKPAAAPTAPPASLTQTVPQPKAPPVFAESAPAPSKMPSSQRAMSRAKAGRPEQRSLSTYGGKAPASGAVEPRRDGQVAGSLPALDARRALQARQSAVAESIAPEQSQPGKPMNSPQAEKMETAAVPFWNPLLVTGDNGRAQFDLPAGSAKCRIVVDAYANGRLGSIRVDVPAQAP